MLGDGGMKMVGENIASLKSVLAVKFLLSPRGQQSRSWGIGFKIPAVVRVKNAGDLKFQEYCVYWGQVYYLPHIHNAHKHILFTQFLLGVSWSLCLTFQDPIPFPK